MSNDQPDEEAIFKAAREIKSSDAQAAYLSQVCAGDDTVRARVVSLLQAEAEDPGFLESPVAAILTTEPSEIEKPGARIGCYKLLELVGEGGMGLVYMADQESPVRRRVALKIIKPGMDTRQVIARFEAERQALALMDHPNIARVLDAGATDAGRPYFVMELVRGVPITEYCDDNHLPVHGRLSLFVQVCQAVQHAHQKGIIHRDLKPSNVLVTLHDGRPVPKVIDFGVAKATNQQLTERTLFTNFSQMIGTPLYMSPEQAEMSGLDVDTRSDVYSLGVLLYELLTGTTPFDGERIRQAPFDEIRRIIREVEPTRPSVFVDTQRHTFTTAAARRSIDPGRIAQVLRGDLDWIVMKALDKDRTRRYPTASDFAKDIDRFLQDLPIEARSPSARYRFNKFARRHRAVLTTAIFVLVALLLGSAVSVWQAARAWRAEQRAEAARAEETRQRQIAERERNEAQKQRERAEVNFKQARKAVDDYLTAVSQSKLGETGSWPLRKELLESALTYYLQFIDQHADDPTVRAELAAAYLRVGDINSSLGSKDEALQAIRKAIDQYRQLIDANPAATAYQAALANALVEQSMVELGLRRLSDMADSCRGALTIYQRLRQVEPGVEEYRDGAARALANLGIAQSAAQQTAEAEQSYRRAIEIHQELVRRHPDYRTYRADLAKDLYHLGHLQRATSRMSQAEASFRQAGEIFESLVAEDPGQAGYQSGLAQALHNLGIVNRALGRPKEALAATERARDACQRLAHENPTVATFAMGNARSLFRLGLLASESGDGAAAERHWTAAVDAFDIAANLGYRTVETFTGLADAFAVQGRWEEAAQAYSRVVNADDQTAKPLARLALLYAAAGDDAQYRATCSQLATRYAANPASDEALWIAMACAVRQNAIEDWPQVVEIARRAAASAPDDPLARVLVGAALTRVGQTAAAIAHLKDALSICAVAESAVPSQRDKQVVARLIVETYLALAYRDEQNNAALAAQTGSLRALIEDLSGKAPQFGEGEDIWLRALWICVAQRELAQLEGANVNSK